LISQIDSLEVTRQAGEPGTAAFLEGVIIGLVPTSLVFGVISGVVIAALACFASSPVDFEHNHPERYEMRSAWRDAWPGAFDASDLQLALESASTGRSRSMSASSFEGRPLLQYVCCLSHA